MRTQGIHAALLLSLSVFGCQSLTAHEKVRDVNPGEAGKAEKNTPSNVPAGDPHAGLNMGRRAPTEAAPPTPPTPPPQQAAPTGETATASHILIRYAGAARTGPEITRTKDDARKLAQKVDKKAKSKGTDFAKLADEFTEDPSGKGRGGKLGTFPKGTMVPEFDKPLFEMKPGDVSDVVETGFGFHIIKREN